MRLKDKHILDWKLDNLNQLKNIIINKYKNYSSLSEDTIIDILLCGSRVHYLSGDPKNNIYFNEESDLDISIVIKDEVFKKHFISIDLLKGQRFTKKGKKLWQLFPTLPSFFYDNILCSVFIESHKEKGISNNIIINRYYNKWNLGYYSLFKHYYYFGNICHKADYIINFKRRLDKYMYCIICNEHKKSSTQLHIKVISEQSRLEDDEYTRDWKYCICKECYNKLFSNGIEHFINHLREVKEKCI